MSLTAAGLWVASLWLVIYAAKYSSKRQKTILPLSQQRRPTTEVTVKHFTVRLRTEAFNAFHDQLCSRLSSTQRSKVSRQALLRLYDIGTFVAVIGMVLGFCLLFLTVLSLSSEIWHAGRVDLHNSTAVQKRGLDYNDEINPSVTSNALRISPVIPGLTVPLSHLPLILIALAISQIVHEAGHAIAAALHRVPVLSCGVAVTFLFPSAFITLPVARLEKLPPRDRLQIVSGGCFHNFAFLCLLLAIAWSGVGSLPTRFLFQDISVLGKLVIDVDNDSPLATHLPTGTLIVQIDDFSMESTSSKDPWDHYLLSPSLGSMRGWCANDSLLNETLAPTCTSVGRYSCFLSKADESTQYELDPIDIVTSNLTRCDTPVECSSLSSCIIPRPDQQLTRISVSRYDLGTNAESIIVWKGPKEEIWEQVQVGDLRPRFPLLSPKLPKVASTFFEYMKMANLSLYLINTLPIMALDGYQLLSALLQFLFGAASDCSQNIDLEAVNNATRLYREGRVQRTCSAFLSLLALLLVVLCGLLGTISWARQ